MIILGKVYMPKKTIYISEGQMPVWHEAANLFKGEKSFSQIIIEALKNEIQKKKELGKYKPYLINDQGVPTKLIGNKLANYRGASCNKGDKIKPLHSKTQNTQVCDKSDWYEDRVQISNHVDGKKLSGYGGEVTEELHFEFNSYQTKPGYIYVEIIKFVKIKAPSKEGLNKKSTLIHVRSVKKFINEREYNVPQMMFSSEEYYFGDYFKFYPEKFVADIKKALGDNIPIVIIE